MFSVYESFQSQTGTELEDNVETLLQSKQHAFDEYVRQATTLSHVVESKRTKGEANSPETTALKNLLQENIYPIIADLRGLQQKYDEEAIKSRNNFNENQDLWTTTTAMEDTSKHINVQQQRFDSIKALSTQSLSFYHHQNNVLWCHVALFVLLLAVGAYLYYYVYSMSDGEYSLANLPDNPKELLDNDYVELETLLPSEKPIDGQQNNSNDSSFEE